jgi:hypothetical protein
MKAKELAELLLKHPDLEVVAHSEAYGYSMPVMGVVKYIPEPSEADIIVPFLTIYTDDL